MYDIWHSFFHHLFVALLNNLFRHPIGLGVKVQTINHIVSTIGGLSEGENKNLTSCMHWDTNNDHVEMHLY